MIIGIITLVTSKQKILWNFSNIFSLQLLVILLPREIENYPAIFEGSQWGDVTGAESGLATLHFVKVSSLSSLTDYYYFPCLTSLLTDLGALIYPHHRSHSPPLLSTPLLSSLINENRNCLLLLLQSVQSQSSPPIFPNYSIITWLTSLSLYKCWLFRDQLWLPWSPAKRLAGGKQDNSACRGHLQVKHLQLVQKIYLISLLSHDNS